MAITEVKELQDGRTGKWGRNWKRSYTRRFRVITDTATDDQAMILFAVDPNTGTRIPWVGQIYTAANGNFDGGAFCEEVECENEAEDGKSWLVTVNYGPYDATQFDAQNPLEAPPKVRWGLSRSSRAADVDTDGNAVTNSAGQSFDPPVEKDDSRLTLTIELNIPTFDPMVIAQYKDAVNSDQFWGFDPKMVKCMNIAADLAQSGDCPTQGGFYWATTYEFEIHEDTWTKKILDQGLMCVDASGNLQYCVDNNNDPVSEPVPLDGNGGQLATGGTPVFRSFDVYDELEFAALGLTPRGLP